MDLPLRKKFTPLHTDNRMRHEGDVVKARDYFINNNNKNLYELVKGRNEWMNDYINENDKGIEVGSGSGLSKFFIKNKNFQLTDYTLHDWLDIPNVDALDLPFQDNELDFIVSGNMIHHVPYVMNFFEEMNRVLKPGGKLIIQEIYSSYLMRLILRLMKHEGYDFNINIWDKNVICTNPNDLWSANCVIPNLLFNDMDTFKKNVPYFNVILKKHTECLMLLNSGGVIAKTRYIPLARPLLNLVKGFDKFLCKIAPRQFAMQMQLILVKK
jgi:SAM-dependent methyltransferase